ncbi:MAG: diguanylate cyclase, partial [Clostridiales bacterium]|nr:diguanylate cyclase [Clostridiales bacterium]
SALLVAYGIYRYKLFEVLPNAHKIIIRQMRSGMVVLNNDGVILEINPAAVKMLCLPAGQYTGELLSDITDIPDFNTISGTDSVREIYLPHSNNDYYYELSNVRIRNVKNESIGQLLQIYDITARKQNEQAALSAAQFDPLTDTINRRQFEARVSKAIKNAAENNNTLTVVFLDIDNFKNINDSYGHDIGDFTLKTIARRLKDTLRESDLICRIGGDEFVLALLYLGDDAKIRQIGDKLMQTLESPIEIGDLRYNIKASIGFSVYPKDGETFEDLLKKADIAMYESKSSKEPGYRIFGEYTAGIEDNT